MLHNPIFQTLSEKLVSLIASNKECYGLDKNTRI